MRLSDDEFASLTLLHDFRAYYEKLNNEELIEELDRVHTTGSKLIILHQHLALHKRFVEIACFDQALTEEQRSAIIGVATGLRDSLDKVILPSVDAQTAGRASTALASNDDYVSRFGYYPRAVEMIRVGARNPSGPYELGPIGEILRKSDNSW